MTTTLSPNSFKLNDDEGRLNLGNAYLYILSLDIKRDKKNHLSEEDDMQADEAGEEHED